MQFFLLFLISLPVLVALDLLWLGVIAKSFYFSQLGDLARAEPNWYAAAVFYPIFILGLTFFASHPAFLAGSLGKAILLGAFFGFVVYATYDLTNLAVLKNWPLAMSLVDIAWGAFLGGAVSAAAYSVLKALS